MDNGSFSFVVLIIGVCVILFLMLPVMFDE